MYVTGWECKARYKELLQKNLLALRRGAEMNAGRNFVSGSVYAESKSRGTSIRSDVRQRRR
jgi:hypothetical protein